MCAGHAENLENDLFTCEIVSSRLYREGTTTMIKKLMLMVLTRDGKQVQKKKKQNGVTFTTHIILLLSQHPDSDNHQLVASEGRDGKLEMCRW